MNKKTAGKIWLDFVFARKHIYLVGMLTLVLTNLMQISLVRTMGFAIDLFNNAEIPALFVGANDLDTFKNLFLFYLICAVTVILGRFGWRITFGRQTHHASGYLARNIWDNARFFPKEKLDKKYPKGVLMNAQTSDVSFSRFIFGFTLVGLFDAIFLSILTIIAMLTISPLMTISALVLSLFLPFVVKKISELEITQYRQSQDSLGDFNDLSSQAVETIRLQRLTQTQNLWRKKLMESANVYRNKRLNAVFTSLKYFPVMSSSSIVSFFVLFAAGIPFVFNGSMSIGDFVAMQGLIVMLQDPLAEIGIIISEWKKGMTGLDRLASIFNEEKDQTLLNPGTKINKTEKIIEASKLSFTFPDSINPVFSDISFCLNNGERLGIAGPIGAGKTVLLSVVSGLERNFRGDLKFFGRCFDEYSHEDIRKYIGIVPQKPFLFAESIRQNMLMDLNKTDEEIWHYLNLAGMSNDVSNFTDGLDTQLGEWGINLSGGQKQRLTLARSLIRKPDLLLLDDCLSAVDTVTEEKILQNLDQELKNTTLIWVAHRLSTLKYCDKFMTMEKISNE